MTPMFVYKLLKPLLFQLNHASQDFSIKQIVLLLRRNRHEAVVQTQVCT